MLVSRLKGTLKSRGIIGFIGMQRRFRVMDDDGNKTLTAAEFKKAMKEMEIGLSDSDLRALFDFFDEDHSGTIDFEEFLHGLRDPLTPRRLDLVKQAFARIDLDGNGIVDAQEIVKLYDASKHPDVIAGKRTPESVLREFLETFDVGGEVDGKVTMDEFVNYYTNLGASIDNDDYFELMIRNAWHISGGTGAAANSANRRVLVTDAQDGSERVVEVTNDLGLGTDVSAIKARLRTQGVESSHIYLFGSGGDAQDDAESFDTFGEKALRRRRKRKEATTERTKDLLFGSGEEEAKGVYFAPAPRQAPQQQLNTREMQNRLFNSASPEQTSRTRRAASNPLSSMHRSNFTLG
jgi:Ca2+-binding EF-hand superfamily protein